MPKLMEHDGTKASADKYHVVVYNKKLDKYVRYYMESTLKENLDEVKKLVKNNWDAVYVIDGEVGSGKSCYAMQIGFYISEGHMTYDDLCWQPSKFRHKVSTSPKLRSIQWDEAFRGASSRSAMSAVNRLIMTKFKEIRKRNLFVFVVLDSIWDLDSYIAKQRLRGLFHIYTKATKDNPKKRGFFRFYNKEQVRIILESKKKYKYPSRFSFKGRFYQYYPIEDTIKGEKYEELANRMIEDDKDEENILTKVTLKENRRIINLLKYTELLFNSFDTKTLQKVLNVQESTVYDVKKRLKLMINGDVGGVLQENPPIHSDSLHNLVNKGIKKAEIH